MTVTFGYFGTVYVSGVLKMSTGRILGTLWLLQGCNHWDYDDDEIMRMAGFAAGCEARLRGRV